MSEYLGQEITPAQKLHWDQLANLGAQFEVAPAFIGEPVGNDQWAWELGQRETAWCRAHPEAAAA